MLRSFFINTYGCQMNVHESEKIAGVLLARGLCAASDPSHADLIVYNTCCIRETAETKVYGNLGRAKQLKDINPAVKIVLCGCLPQKPGAGAILKKRFPYVDLIIGTHNINLLGDYLDKLTESSKICEIWDTEKDVPEVPAFRAGGVRAWLNIMYGCDNFCSYCIVPYVRGRERSRDFSAILDEAAQLLAEGYKEITLLGQNVNSYQSGGKDFAALLRALDALKVGGDVTKELKDGGSANGIKRVKAVECTDGQASTQSKFRIKFMTSHPKDLSESVIQAIAEGENIAKFVHLPIQAGSNRILKLMNRKYTADEYLSKISMIRAYMPDAGLSTDMMVGFPTETEGDFLDTMRIVDEVRFNNIYTFIYNRRSGTAADAMDGHLTREVKTERIERLIKRQFQIGTAIAGQSLGQTYEVLCEGVSVSGGFGKTQNDKAVTFVGAQGQKTDKSYIGRFVNVRITGSKNNNLTGAVIDNI